MTVLLIERAPASLRGHITRWMLEVDAGVFVGTLSARVREKLLSFAAEKLRGGAAVCIHRAQNEQGFAIEVVGKRSRMLADFDGLALIRRVKTNKKRGSVAVAQGDSPGGH